MRALFVLLLPILGVLSTDSSDCATDQFYNSLLSSCEKCSSCEEFMYIRKPCTAESNTECGWCARPDAEKTKNYFEKCENMIQHKVLVRKLMKEFQDAAQDDAIITEDRRIFDYKSKHQPNEGETESDDSSRVIARFVGPISYKSKILRFPIRHEDYIPEDKLSSSYEDDDSDLSSEEDSLEQFEPQEIDEMNIDNDEVLKKSAEVVDDEKEDTVKVYSIRRLKLPEAKNSDEADSEGEYDDEVQDNEEYRIYRAKTAQCILFFFLLSFCCYFIYRTTSRRRERFVFARQITQLSPEQRGFIEKSARNVQPTCYENKLAYV